MFSAAGIPVLALLILALTLSAYLASLRSPHRATRYLVAAFALQVIWSGATIVQFQFGQSGLVILAQMGSATFVFWCVLQFAYTFLEQPFGREYAISWWTTLGVVAASILVGAVTGPLELTLLTAAAMILIGVWGIAVLVRKVVILTRRTEPGATVLQALLRTPVRAARAQRAVLAPGLIALSIIVLYVLVVAGLVSGVAYNVWLRSGLLFALILFALILFTFGQERHTVQIKLVGVALTIVLSVLAFVSMLLIEPVEGPGPSALATRMALMIVAASVVTVIAFPLAYRTNLLEPIANLLHGIRRVDAGDLAVEVPVLVNDEIGEVTRSFNEMAASLKEYSERLEGLVAERTSELERSLRELEAAQSRLVQQEKLASLGALTAGIAHEIKNPLNFVNNFAALARELVDELREELPATSEAEALETILSDLEQNTMKVVEHGRRADSIVRSMLMHSRGGAGDLERVDLNDLLDEYVNLAYHGMRAQRPDFRCEIQRSLADGLPPIEAVPQDLGRVVLNILNNAFYALGERSRTNGSQAPAVSLSTARVGEHVEIRIRDNGPGIPDDLRRRIFEPFFTTKPTGEGTGLGLSMSHDIIVRGHGGSIDIASGPGEGTTFVITLPLIRPVEEHP